MKNSRRNRRLFSKKFNLMKNFKKLRKIDKDMEREQREREETVNNPVLTNQQVKELIARI